MEQPDNNQSKAIKQHSATTDGSDKTSTPPKNLPDMPVDVVGLIIERSDYKQQLKLRKVSKSLRALVDKHKPACKSIKVKFRIPNITMIFDNHSVIYANREYKVDAYDFGIIVRSDDFKKNALDDLSSALQNPKLQLEEFGVLYYDHGKIAIEKETDNLHNVLESLNHQVSAKKVELHVLSPSTLFSILPYLKPGLLEIISLRLHNSIFSSVNWRIDSTGMDQVVLLEQWKQAKELGLQDSFDRFPLKYATHFKRFQIHGGWIEKNKLNRIKHFLSELNDFEYCRIPFRQLDNIEHYQKITGIPIPPNMSHYSIADSDFCLEFTIAVDGITIVKKICHFH